MISIDGTLVSRGEGGVYGERMMGEFRVWDPYRSKFAALWYLDGSTDLPEGAVVLYRVCNKNWVQYLDLNYYEGVMALDKEYVQT